MAVFSVVAGNPFHYEMDETPFYDTVSDVSSDIFVYAAGRRLWTQQVMYDALIYRNREVIRWLKVGDNPMPSVDEWLTFGLVITLVAVVTILPYLNPYTAPMALALDVYNIYQFFS